MRIIQPSFFRPAFEILHHASHLLPLSQPLLAHCIQGPNPNRADGTFGFVHAICSLSQYSKSSTKLAMTSVELLTG